MRMMLEVQMPHEPFNSFVREGTVGEKLGRCVEAMKADSVYFMERDGLRTAMIAIQLKDSSEVPVYAEPWFLTFQARVHFRHCMSPDDLGKAGLDKLGQKWA